MGSVYELVYSNSSKEILLFFIMHQSSSLKLLPPSQLLPLPPPNLCIIQRNATHFNLLSPLFHNLRSQFKHPYQLIMTPLLQFQLKIPSHLLDSPLLFHTSNVIWVYFALIFFTENIAFFTFEWITNDWFQKPWLLASVS